MLKHQRQAQSKFGIHSPLIFELIDELMVDEGTFYAFEELEDYRQQLLNDSRIIEVTDLGAGSKVMESNSRKIAEIAKYNLQRKYFIQLLFRVAQKQGCKDFLELGTSLGLSTLYFASLDKEVKVTTIEGCKNILSIAKEGFTNFKKQNIDAINGDFDEILATLNNRSFDFVYIDGNHQKEATIRYFNKITPLLKEESIVVFDDINWSEGMQEAWQEVSKHQKVSHAVDLFFIGIVYIRPYKEQQYFKLKLPLRKLK